uniref:SOUL heme-binding protein n=1 Tax=Tetradesmus obliquus TaxID=3088 RepID=A0A383WAA1_TETOB|eukprot:jgi/Sobl393_1/2963/SZX74565.1
MQERMQFLKEDLSHLFDDQGVDASQYDDVVNFLDPITKYSNVQGYMFNIKMLKGVFDPLFELHDIKQTAEYEITTRWTMTMKFTPAQALGVSKWWSPVITFTGTSMYGFNPANGRINRHIDTWDSVANQQFFSWEAFGDFWKQLLQTFTTPALESPKYTLLKRTAKFQVRQYQPFLVASTALDNLPQTTSSSSSSSSGDATLNGTGSSSGSSSSGGGGGGINPASVGIKAFNALAGYIFGGNASSTKMAMTTPVFSSTNGTMDFVVSASVEQVSLASLPAPLDPAVQLQRRPGGIYAAAVFSGVATPRKCSEVSTQLLAALHETRLQPADSSSWMLARYNDPSVKPRFRRNEILVELRDFNLWG